MKVCLTHRAKYSSEEYEIAIFNHYMDFMWFNLILFQQRQQQQTRKMIMITVFKNSKTF